MPNPFNLFQAGPAMLCSGCGLFDTPTFVLHEDLAAQARWRRAEQVFDEQLATEGSAHLDFDEAGFDFDMMEVGPVVGTADGQVASSLPFVRCAVIGGTLSVAYPVHEPLPDVVPSTMSCGTGLSRRVLRLVVERDVP